MDNCSNSSSNDSINAQWLDNTSRDSRFVPSLMPASNINLPRGEHYENLFTAGFHNHASNSVNLVESQKQHQVRNGQLLGRAPSRQPSFGSDSFAHTSFSNDHLYQKQSTARYSFSTSNTPRWSDSEGLATMFSTQSQRPSHSSMTSNTTQNRPHSWHHVSPMRNDLTASPHTQQTITSNYTQNITLQMKDVELWRKYNKLGTEMIISSTKSRRMFPSIRFTVQGLDPQKHYFLWIHFSSPDSPNEQWKWRSDSQSWKLQPKKDRRKHTPTESSNDTTNTEIYNHPWGATLGSKWMELPVNLEDLRLTSNPKDSSEVQLKPFKMYIPVVYIAPAMLDISSGEYKMLPLQATYFRLEMQQFICSSAYHNPEMTILKCHTNPKARSRKVVPIQE